MLSMTHEAHPVVLEDEEELNSKIEELERKIREAEERRKENAEEDEYNQGPVNPFTDDKGFIDGVKKDLDWDFNAVDHTSFKFFNLIGLGSPFQKAHDFIKRWAGMKWFFNIWTVGVPHLIFCIASIGFNIWANVEWNDWWAQGNLFLLANTMFLVMQSFVSLPLLFESPMLLKPLKIVRVYSLGFAIIYNFFYIGTVGEWLFANFIEDKEDFESTTGLFDVFLQLVFAYNAILHAPMLVINFDIIGKEFWLQFYQMISNVNETNPAERVQLGMVDLGVGGQMIVNAINPVYWITYVFEKIFHFPISDFFVLNS